MQKITMRMDDDCEQYIIDTRGESRSGACVYCDDFDIVVRDDNTSIGWIECWVRNKIVAKIFLDREDEVWFSEGPWDMGERIYPMDPLAEMKGAME